MTNGTSQGLFVVVSIVIFGIFVALSYTVFGNTLSQATVELFSEATEKTSLQLQGYSFLDKAILDPALSEIGFINFDFHRYHVDDGSKFHTYRRESDTLNEETGRYDVSYYAYRENRLTEMGSLYRVYIQNSLIASEGYDVESVRLRIDNNDIPVRLSFGINEERDLIRYFVEPIDQNIDLPLYKPVRVDLYLFTTDRDVFHYQKTVFIENENVAVEPE